MNQGRTIFAQLLDCYLSQYAFNQIVDKQRGNHRVRTLSCLDQWRAMAFAQLTGRKSLRDIQNCLRALQDKLYHAGFRGPISRSTLDDANERRPWQMWVEVTLALIVMARPLYAGEDAMKHCVSPLSMKSHVASFQSSLTILLTTFDGWYDNWLHTAIERAVFQVKPDCASEVGENIWVSPRDHGFIADGCKIGPFSFRAYPRTWFWR